MDKYEKKMSETISVCIFFGIRIEDSYEDDNVEFLNKKITIKFSVPEFCKIQKANVDLNGEGLLKQFKKEILKAVYECTECETEEDKQLVNDSFKFLGKIRYGETWTDENFNELLRDFKLKKDEEKSYKEV